MKRKTGIWLLLLAFCFMVIFGGCGGGGGDSSYDPSEPNNPQNPNNPQDPNEPSDPTAGYQFSALVGTWVLQNGSGTAHLESDGYVYNGTASLINGEANISDIEDLGGGNADGNVTLSSEWRLSASGYTVNYPFNLQGLKDDIYLTSTLKKQGDNVFVYTSTYTGFGSQQNTVTITMTSETTASVTHVGEVHEGSDMYSYNVKYNISKR